MYLYFSILRFLCIKLLSLQEFPHFLPIRFSFSASFSSAGRVLQKQPVRFRCRILKKAKQSAFLCALSAVSATCRHNNTEDALTEHFPQADSVGSRQHKLIILPALQVHDISFL